MGGCYVAAHNKLDNLVIFVDQNGLQIDGTVDEVAGIEPLDKKFESFGFEVFKIDGHDFNQIEDALNKAREVKGKPVAILAKTVKGKGVSFMEIRLAGTAQLLTKSSTSRLQPSFRLKLTDWRAIANG